MSDVPEVLAEVPAQALPDTASAEPVVVAPVEVAEEQKEAPKTFTQEELDAAIGKRLAREQRKWEREQQQRIQDAAQAPKPSAEITPDRFETTEAYVEALAEAKAAEKLAQREQVRQRAEVEATYHEKEEVAREKYDDFQQVAYNPKLSITDVMALSIQASDIGPEIAYHLGTNPKEADRIARLAPFLQAKEIGRIEARLADTPPPSKKTTSAPAPISPLKAGSANTPKYDTTDPRSTKSMSSSEWINAERLRQRKNLEARIR